MPAAVVFNPFGPAFIADPYPHYAELRAAEPVHAHPLGRGSCGGTTTPPPPTGTRTSGGRDAGSVRLDRPDAREHLAFGAGVHHCLGAAPARMEGRIYFRELPLAVRPGRLTPKPGIGQPGPAGLDRGPGC